MWSFDILSKTETEVTKDTKELFLIQKMSTEKTICRLCLKMCDKFEDVVGDMKDVLDIVFPKIDLTVIRKPVMCTKCTEILIECFDFKAECFYTHDYIVPFVNNDVKLDLKDIYLRKNENVSGVPKNQHICGFCMSPVKNCSAISVTVEDGDITLKNMIEQCLPELDLEVIKEPVICAHCHGSLENCFHFVTNCFIVEAKIKKYCETLDTDSKDQIELSSLLQFIIRDATKREADGNLVVVIKEEDQFSIERENTDKKKIGNKGGIFKLDQMFCEEENLVEGEDQKLLVNEEISIKTDEQDFNRFEDGIIEPQPEAVTRLRRRQNPNLEGHLSKPYIKHASTNKIATKTMYRCDYCSHQTKRKFSLKSHLLRHKNHSEVRMYNCDSCSFQTRHKGALNTHQLVHKGPSEVTMYNCDSCSYQTKHKCALITHQLVHKGPSEVTVYNCASCSYQTRHKSALKVHRLVHKDPSEVTMYKCDSCSYQTKRKYNLQVHLLVHKDPVYNCACCSFQTKTKGALNRHQLVHKGPSEVTMYKCSSCAHQTKHKRALITHQLVHKDPSEITMYNCESCSFQTKKKGVLNIHRLVHKSPSEITMFNCDFCEFQTKRKGALNSHRLIHMGPSEVTMYKCNSCSYQTKRKHNLKAHLLVHK